jgi:hypothetical protein
VSPRRRNREEERIHRAVADWLRANGVYFTHVPNEEANALQRQIKAALGTLPGVSDLLIFDAPTKRPEHYEACHMCGAVNSCFMCEHTPGQAGAVLEIKAPDKKPTDEQRAFLAEMDRRGWATHWSDDLDDALSWLRSLGYGKREQRMTPPAKRPAGSAKRPHHMEELVASHEQGEDGASPHTQRRR